MKRHGEAAMATRHDAGKSLGKVRGMSESVRGNVISTIHDMERMMEEAFHRPLFGMTGMPFGHLFHSLDSVGDFRPSVDIFEGKGEVVVKAELPGMQRDEITVKLVDNRLIISGEKKTEEKIEREGFLRLERSTGTFHRTLCLPAGIDEAHVSATFKDGVLEIRVPKKEGETGPQNHGEVNPDLAAPQKGRSQIFSLFHCRPYCDSLRR